MFEAESSESSHGEWSMERMSVRRLETCRDDHGICPSHIADCCPECLIDGGEGPQYTIGYMPQWWDLNDKESWIRAHYICGQGHQWMCGWSLGAGQRGALG